METSWVPIATENLNIVTEPVELFDRALDLWWNNVHIINRRISTGIRLKEWDKVLLKKFDFNDQIEALCKLVPKSSMYSKNAFEIRKIIGQTAHFIPLTLDGLPNPHIPIPYQIVLDSSTLSLGIYVPMQFQSHPICVWLKNHAFPQFVKFFNYHSTKVVIYSHAMIDSESYAITYERIKESSGKEVVKKWTEKTDPQKFVYEDCAIASYLIELWGKNRCPQQSIDVGCGNGLLVYLLSKERINCIGIDIRKRKIWDNFRLEADLREVVLDPSSVNNGIPDGTDFLIGNHSDELTPWIPIMAARLKCGFFLLPCCPFDLFGKFSRRSTSCIPFAQDLGKFGQYFSHIYEIVKRLGFDIQLDRLKIPSTKRLCIIGSIPEDGLPIDIDERIDSIIIESKNYTKETFVPRPTVEQVKNCSTLPMDVRIKLTKKIFDRLLSLNSQRINDWRCGGSEKIVDLVKILTTEEKEHLHNQNGGFQTYLKNQHQVRNGCVNIRNWVIENEIFLSKQKDLRKSECWFYRNHPDRCPFDDDKCAFRH